MKGVTVSIDRIVIDFIDVYWDFFNEFHKRICHYYGVRMTVGGRGFQYRIKINTGEHFLHISYRLVYAPKTCKNTLRIEAYPKSLASGIGLNKSETMPTKSCLCVVMLLSTFLFSSMTCLQCQRRGGSYDCSKELVITTANISVRRMATVGCMTRSVSCWRQGGRKPKGSKRGWKLYMLLRTGTVNPLFGFEGGGQQFDLMGQRVGNFKNPRSLQRRSEEIDDNV